MVDLSRNCNDVKFILVIGDESEKTKELCKREKIDKVPHFSFYKSMEKIHEKEGIGPDQLMGQPKQKMQKKLTKEIQMKILIQIKNKQN